MKIGRGLALANALFLKLISTLPVINRILINNWNRTVKDVGN